MNKYQRIITFIMLIVISLSNVVTPASYAAELSLGSFTVPGTDLGGLSFAPKPKFKLDTPTVLAASTSLLTVANQALDLRQTTVGSASKRIPVEMQRLDKKVYRTDEDVTLAVVNPDNDVFTTAVTDAKGQGVSIPITETNNGTTTTVNLEASDTIKPGAYKVIVTDQNGKSATQDFSWGVLALNTDKTIYHPGETADIAMGVLNDQGDMVCDARLELTIKNDALGINDHLSTSLKDENQITVSPQCQKHDFSLMPDYEGHYKFGGAGTYQFELTALTTHGTHTITDEIQVQDVIPFDVQRVSATRIYPPNDYPMIFNITANRDFDGTVTETVPDSFTITPATQSAAQPYTAMQTVYLNSTDPAALMSQQIASSSGGLVMPFQGNFPITQGFGAQLTDPSLQAFYIHYGLGGHDGIDFGLPMNTPLYAVDAGSVIWSGPGDYGTMVTIQHAWGKTYYGHMSNTSVNVGQQVSKGQLIGYSGMSGEATGPHLHFGMKPNSPDMTNGYYGKIDPMPFLPIGQGQPISMLGARANPLASMVYSNTVLGASDSATTPTPSIAPTTEPSVSPAAQPTDTPTPTVAPTTAPVASGAAEQVVASPTPAPTSVPSVFDQPTANIGANTNFDILDKEIRLNEQIASSAVTDKVKILTWKVKLKKGEKTALGYAYQAPHVSPQFYLLGPAKFYAGGNERVVFQEQRQWQIASDDVGVEWYQNTTNSSLNGYSWQYRKKLTIDHTKVNAGVLALDAVYPLPSGTGTSAGQNSAASTTLSWNHTVTGTHPALLVGVSVGGVTAGATITATYGASNKHMNLLRMAYSDEVDGFHTDFVAVFGLVNPPTGSNSINISLNCGCTPLSMEGGSESFTGVSGFGQPMINSGDGTGGVASVTLNNTTTNNIIAGIVCNGSSVDSAVAPNSDRVIDNDSSSSGCGNLGISTDPSTGSSQILSWNVSVDFWAAIAVEVMGLGQATPTATFMDAGGDATNGASGNTNLTSSTGGFYSATSGTVAFDTGTKETGLGALKFTSGASGAVASASATTVLDDMGRRVSAYYNFTNLPAATDSIMSFQTSGNTQMFAVRITSAGALELDVGKANSMSSVGTGAGFTFSTGTWYRISVGYTVTNATTYTIDVYVNGTLSLSATNSTSLGTTTTSGLFLGWVSPNDGNSLVMYIDDIYVDSGNDNSDTGDVHVTVKRPNANGASSQFTTQIGTGDGSGYPVSCTWAGGCHAGQVNERQLSTTNGVSVVAAATEKIENYSLEGASTGDVDISAYNYIANQSWAYEKEAQAGCTGSHFYFNGDQYYITLTTSNAMYSQIENNPYYPSGTSAVGATGCNNSSGTHVTNLYETGMQIAYTTLTPVTSSLSNFPALVSLSGDNDIKNARTNCADVVFTDSTGRTKLNYEIDENLNTLNDCQSGNLYAWVQIPTLSANTDTIIYMYYGNPSASNQSTNSTWDSNYKGVWHYNDGTGTGVTDSTSNTNSGTLTNSSTWTTSGEIGEGFTYGNFAQVNNAGSKANIDNMSSGITTEAWLKNTTSTSGNDRVIEAKVDSSGFNSGWEFNYDALDGQLIFNESNTGADDVHYSSIGSITNGSWQHIVATWDGTTTSQMAIHLYINGVEVTYGGGQDGSGTYVSDASNNLTMGAYPDTPNNNNNLVGSLDEVRVSNTVRSAGWVQTEYNSESSPSTFVLNNNGVETSIYAPTLDKLMRHGQFFDSTGAMQPFVF